MDEILTVAIASFLARLIEDCRKIGLTKADGRRLKNVHGLYEAFNLHVAITVALFALLLAHGDGTHYHFPVCLGLLLLGGVVSKGVFSQHKPERLGWADMDGRWGLIIPNGCAIAAILIGVYVISWGKAGKGWFSGHHFIESEILLTFSVLIGVFLSALITGFGVKLLSCNIDEKEKLRVHATGILDILLAKAEHGDLGEADTKQLKSNLMSYMMTATSPRTARKYLKRLKPLTSVIGEGLYNETEEVFKDRFPRG